MDKIKKTSSAFGFLWKRIDAKVPSHWQHFDEMQEVIPEPIAKGRCGIDIGSGPGYDTYIMASSNPSVKIISLEISDGIYKTKKLVSGLSNVYLTRASALELPLKSDSLDFAYSFGVLHHTPSPNKCVSEIARIIKKGSPAFLYLYEDHSENLIKYLAVKIMAILRIITTRMPHNMLYIGCYLFSPVIVLFFSYPAMFFRKFKATRYLADRMPFNFGTHLFSVAGDLYDRFSAPIEYRFNRKETIELLSKNGFTNIKIDRLKTKAGWVVWGYKR